MSIGNEAFFGCSSLTSITIPSSVTSIGSYAFVDCSKLTRVNITDLSAWINVNKSWYLFDTGYSLYLNGTILKEIEIPDSVTSIGSFAFYYCSSLTSVTIPDSVTSIGSYAFCGCSSLTSVTIPDSVTSIGYNAFYNCTALTSVTIPDSMKSIGSSAFFSCSKLKDVYYAGTEEEWNAISIADYNTPLKNATIHFNYQHEHTAGEPVRENESPATCDTPNSYELVTYCAVCGEEMARETVTGETLGHDFGDWQTTTAPTCTEPGEARRDCSRCDAFETKEVSALGHDEKIYAQDATCAEGGYVITICTRCGETLSSEILPPTEHSWNAGQVTKDATCTENGMVTYTCTVCGATKTEPTDMLAHNWSNGELTKEPSCTEAGVMTYTCSVGGETRTEPIDKLDHVLVLVPGTPATCTKEGLTDGWKCETCGKVFAEQKTIAATGHTPGNAVRENEAAATCKAEGSYDEVIYCTVCKAELSRETKTIDKLAHTPGEAVRENEVAATCKAEGSYDEVIRCSECDEELSRETKTIDKLAHTPGEAVRENIVEASYDVGGSYDEVVYCSVCHEELSRKTVATDPLTHTHNYVAETTKEPTCSEDGEAVYTCSVCGDTYTEPIPATGEHVDADNSGYCDTCEEMMTGDSHCPYCGKVHGGLFGWLVSFFHRILAIFKR